MKKQIRLKRHDWKEAKSASTMREKISETEEAKRAASWMKVDDDVSQLGLLMNDFEAVKQSFFQ